MAILSTWFQFTARAHVLQTTQGLQINIFSFVTKLFVTQLLQIYNFNKCPPRVIELKLSNNQSSTKWAIFIGSGKFYPKRVFQLGGYPQK